MPKHPAILLATVVLVVAQAPRSHAAPDTDTRRPNILFALADDWGWPHAGVYGDRVVQTPTFDRLAREGVLFRHAYVSSPSCTPCRSSVLTGQQFYRLGEGAHLRGALDVSLPNFVTLLRSSGYETAHYRKAWGPGDYTKGGYTQHPCGKRSTLEQFLQTRDSEKPFCFWFGSSDPHRPYEFDSWREHGIDADRVETPDFFPNTETVRGDIADYYVEVQRWDREVGEALDLLKAAGELDNTIVVMTGDHGMPFPRCKTNLYDWGVRVPLAIRWAAAAPPGRESSGFVSLTDLAPTFLEAAGVRPPASMTGKSLVSLLTADEAEQSDTERRFVVFGRERHVPAQAMPSLVGYPMRGLRTEDWLLILNFEVERWPVGVPRGATHPIDVFADCDDGPTKQFILASRADAIGSESYRLCFAKRPAVELYDCQEDPDQVRNLADLPEYADTVQTLREQLSTYLAETGDPRFTDAPVRFDDYPYSAPYMKGRLK